MLDQAARGQENPPRRPRFSEPQKFLPVAFVVFTISILLFSYLRHHCLPLLQWGLHDKDVDTTLRTRGTIQTGLFLYLTTLLILCYVRCIVEHPGRIPDDDAIWDPSADDRLAPTDWAPMALQETKKTGDRRHCKWCRKYKPDRSHHCRVCRTCILKMDHHCPWLYSCVGFHNYKFFFLLLFYCVLDTHLITWTMLESVKRSLDHPELTPFVTMFWTFFTVLLSFFLMVLTTAFFGFHVMLASKGMTTVEYCEKSLPKKEGERAGRSLYDLGLFGNFRAVLGDHVCGWFFPWSRSVGDGLGFISDDTRLTKDLESGKGIRRRTHQRTQRLPRPLPSADAIPYYSINYGAAAMR